MPNHPLAEVFGYPADNLTPEAERFRKNRLCPYNNKSPNCTKSSVENPLGVCSVFGGQEVVITCPVRFRQDWTITTDAAAFFFPPGATWTSLTEVQLTDGTASRPATLTSFYSPMTRRAISSATARLKCRRSTFPATCGRPSSTTWTTRQADMTWTGAG